MQYGMWSLEVKKTLYEKYHPMCRAEGLTTVLLSITTMIFYCICTAIANLSVTPATPSDEIQLQKTPNKDDTIP